MTKEKLWREMLSKSRVPNEWYQESDPVRWGWRKRVNYEVGYFDPHGIWNQDSVWGNVTEAINRVKWLNGG